MASANILIANGIRSVSGTTANEVDIDVSQFSTIILLARPTTVGTSATLTLNAKDETSGGGLYWQIVGYAHSGGSAIAIGAGLAMASGVGAQLASWWSGAIPMKTLRISWNVTGSWVLAWELWGVRL
jgi:hypothetical protein